MVMWRWILYWPSSLVFVLSMRCTEDAGAAGLVGGGRDFMRCFLLCCPSFFLVCRWRDDFFVHMVVLEEPDILKGVYRFFCPLRSSFGSSSSSSSSLSSCSLLFII